MTTVAAAFEAALATLRAAGAKIDEVPLKAFERLPALQGKVNISAAEAYWWHREMLAKDEARYDAEIAKRIRGGEGITAAEYIDLLRGRDCVYRRVRGRKRGLRCAAVADRRDRAAHDREL